MSNVTENSIRQSQLVSTVSGHENSFIQSVVKLNNIMSLWISRYRQRIQLAQLEPHVLKDLGLTQEQVYKESLKPFWK